MRRLLATLLASLVVGPGFARAQAIPSSGQVLFSPDAKINQADCASTSTTVGLTWQVKPDSTFTTGGTFVAYASNRDFGTASPYCYTASDSGTGLVVRQVVSSMSAGAATMTTSQLVKTADLASVTAQSGCATGSYTIYVCVQWLNSSSAVSGYAKGTVSLVLDGPAAPTVTAVTPGDNALNVSVAAGTGSTIDAVEYRAKAVAVDPLADGATHYATRSSSTTQRIAGLQNGVAYTVTAFAYSSEGNESVESAPFGTTVAPRPVADGWDYYGLAGGRDDGGCQAGGAGFLALLAAAALPRLRRRP